MIPLTPGWTAVTRAIFLDRHHGSYSWMLNFAGMPLFRVVSSCKYSDRQRFQKCWRIFCICCHDESRPSGKTVRPWSGTVIKDSSIKKLLGVRTVRPFRSDEIGVNGRELRITSIFVVRVRRPSNDNSASPITRVR